MDVASAVSTSTSTLRGLQPRQELHVSATSPTLNGSQPSSPRSSALPSPPDSPSESISSLPSVGSSFFFSSAAASPPHSHPQSDHGRESTQGLIIPSLTLPEALPRPTQYGKTLGDIRLLVIGDAVADHTLVSSLLLDDNEDVVDTGDWEATSDGYVLRASTDWIEHKDAHGLEKFEPSRNIELIARRNASSILPIVHSPFHPLLEMIDQRCQPSGALANLIASPWTPLYTALIILTDSGPSSVENDLIDTLAPHIPVIVFRHGLDQTRFPPRPHMSSFRPSSSSALRCGLFRSPETLSSLRYEAAERFLRWREVERAVVTIAEAHRETASYIADEKPQDWDKAKWEAEWEMRLSRDVAARARENIVTSRPDAISQPVPCVDPLHLSSLLTLSFSLFEPVRECLQKSMSGALEKLSDAEVRFALLGTFCIGIGIGLMIR